MPRALIVCVEDRWGAARLPESLKAAGFRVAAISADDIALAASSHLEARWSLPRARSIYRLGGSVLQAMHRWRPHLVIPADEQMVALLQALLVSCIEGTKIPGLTAEVRRALERSLGPPAQFKAMLLKGETQKLARQVGVAIPAGGEAATLDEARAWAERLGYPVVLKQSFSCSGVGVKVCHDLAGLQNAFAALAPHPQSAVKRLIRRASGRSWFPEQPPLWVQACIDGDPAMYTFAAFNGEMLSGFAGRPRQTNGATGHSTVVDIGPDQQMADASRRMIAALGFTGFAGFDFMIERATGRAYLLELNARPNQVTHLGPRVGVDLCLAMRRALMPPTLPSGPYPAEASSEETVTLFPQEWRRAPDSPALTAHFHDVPWGDPSLLARMVTDGAPHAAVPVKEIAASRSKLRGAGHHLFPAIGIKT